MNYSIKIFDLCLHSQRLSGYEIYNETVVKTNIPTHPFAQCIYSVSLSHSSVSIIQAMQYISCIYCNIIKFSL